jgi:hypothetical protein
MVMLHSAVIHSVFSRCGISMRPMLVPGFITASREEGKAHSRQCRKRQAQKGKEGSSVDKSLHDRELSMNDYWLN